MFEFSGRFAGLISRRLGETDLSACVKHGLAVRRIVDFRLPRGHGWLHGCERYGRFFTKASTSSKAMKGPKVVLIGAGRPF